MPNEMIEGKEENCFELFRRNNCTLNKPIGEICQQLHRCITNIGKNSTFAATFLQSRDKIASIEELLENFLLLLGGMGVMGIIHRFSKSSLIQQTNNLINTFADYFKREYHRIRNR